MLRFGWWVGSVLVLATALHARSKQDAFELRPGRRITGVPSPDARPYSLKLKAGEAALITVFERQADLAISVVQVGEAGDPVVTDGAEIDREAVTIVAPSEGDYRIKIRCVSSCTARSGFELSLDSIHPASEKDRDRQRAARAATEAKKLFSQRSYDAAAVEAAKSAAIWRSLAEVDYEATAIEWLGQAHYYRGASFQEAEADFRRALSLLRGRSPVNEASLLNDIAMCRQKLGFPADALKNYAEADRLLEPLPEAAENHASVLSNIGVLYCEMGDCDRAIAFHRRAIRILERSNRSSLAVVYNSLATAYSALGDDEAALEIIERSRPIFKDAPNAADEASVLRNVGLLKIRLGRPDAARVDLDRALSLAGDRAAVRADILSAICRAQVASKRQAADFPACDQALDAYRGTSDPRNEAYARQNRARAMEAMGKHSEAESDYRESVRIQRGIGDTAGLSAALAALAKLDLQRGRNLEALQSAREATDLSESLRARVATESLRTSLFASKQEAYDAYIEALVRTGAGAGAAFEVAERRRARTLLDLLGEARLKIRSGISPDLADAEDRAMGRLRYLAQTGRQTDQLDEALREYQEIEARIRNADPRYAQLLNPAPPKLADIQSQLERGEALVEYSLGEARSYVWVVTRTDIGMRDIAPRRQLEEEVRRLRAVLNHQGNPAAAVAALRRDIIAPIASLVSGMTLAIAPDGALEYVPFALLTPANEIAVLPSATSVAMHRLNLMNRTPASRPAVVFADPVFDVRAPGPRLRSLPYTLREAERISQLAPASRAFKGGAATREAFLNRSNAQYRIVHVATHALVDTRRPELSYIALSQTRPDGRLQDGAVRLYEIFNLNLPAELVVLSACSTADGKEMRGEGLVGLTQGFLFAGARAVLVTLWPVDDEGSSVFMKEFYSRLLGPEKPRPVAALRAAQRAMRTDPVLKRFSDPYYWAAFELQGDWR